MDFIKKVIFFSCLDTIRKCIQTILNLLNKIFKVTGGIKWEKYLEYF